MLSLNRVEAQLKFHCLPFYNDSLFNKSGMFFKGSEFFSEYPKLVKI